MDIIKFRHIISISILFSLGNLIIYLGNNDIYLWQNLLISFLLSLIILLIYQSLLNKYPNYNLFMIIKLKFNKVISSIIITLYLLMLLYNLSSSIFTFMDFISTVNQSDFMSKEIIMLFHFLLMAFVLKNSIYELGRFSQVISVITLIMIVTLYALGIKNIDYTNILPFKFIKTEKSIDNILNLLIQPFLELTFLYNIICKMENTKNKKRIFVIISSISLIILLLISTEIVGLLGKHYTSYLNYPYYTSISCINMSKIVIKIESLSLLIVYFSGFTKFILIVYTFILGINSLFNTKKKIYNPILLLVNVLGMIIFQNIKEMFYIQKYYNYYAFIIITLIPLLLIIKSNRKKNNIKYILKKNFKI